MRRDGPVPDEYISRVPSTILRPDECRALVEDSGLVFQDLFLRASYYPPTPTTSPFFTAIAAMPREQQWSIMQRINASNACHYFLACRPERPAESYAINFDSEAALDYVRVRKGVGEVDLPVTFGGITFTPGEYVYADNNGVLVASKVLI